MEKNFVMFNCKVNYLLIVKRTVKIKDKERKKAEKKMNHCQGQTKRTMQLATQHILFHTSGFNAQT